MKIVHFSDWHGHTFPLPHADLYVCTGDMLPNFRVFVFDVAGQGRVEWEHNIDLLGDPSHPPPVGTLIEKKLTRDREITFQTRYLKKMGHGHLRTLFANKDAPVVCCRGNHDYIDLAPAFARGPTFEISDDPTRTFLWSSHNDQLRIGGVRGMRRDRGRWSDELTLEEFSDRARRLPDDIDVLVTHSPPEGILDEIPGASLGSPALRAYVTKRDLAYPPLSAHLFGHIHEAYGTRTLGETIFSNAACRWHEIELEEEVTP